MRWKRIQDMFTGAVITALFISIAVAIIIRIPVAPYPSIINVNRIEIPEPIVGCPGDLGRFFISFDVTRPSILRTYITYVNEAGITVLPNENIGPVYAHEKEITVERWYEFSIPPLEPGNYRRITAIDTLDVDSSPSFFSIPFTVMECGVKQ